MTSEPIQIHVYTYTPVIEKWMAKSLCLTCLNYGGLSISHLIKCNHVIARIVGTELVITESWFQKVLI